MIEDILFESFEFVLEMNTETPGGVINGLSMDGSNFDFTVETSSVFVT